MPERIRAIQRLWRTKDIEGIKEHQRRIFEVPGEKDPKVTIVDFQQKKRT